MPLPFLRTQKRKLVSHQPPLSHATNDHLTVRGIQHWLPAHTHNSLYLETRYSEWLRPFPVPSFFEISRIFHGQIGSTLEKQLSPLPFWEILLRALIPHKQTSIIQSANVWICLQIEACELLKPRTRLLIRFFYKPCEASVKVIGCGMSIHTFGMLLNEAVVHFPKFRLSIEEVP